MKIGDILDFPIVGTVPCDGKPYRIVEYGPAYRELGKRYGAAGVGCFRVPDLPGRHVVLTLPKQAPTSVLPEERFPLWKRKPKPRPLRGGRW